MGVSVRGQIIAVMVMYQESTIRNLANDGSSAQVSQWPAPGRAYWLNVTKLSLKYPHDRFGLLNGAHDTDSIGLYQQRPAWGWGNYGISTGVTDPEGVVQRLLDPRWEAMAFFGGTRSAAPTSGLLDVVGWENMAPTVAAEAVQGSTLGNLYAKWEAPATTYVNANQDAPAIDVPWYPGGGAGALACTSIPTDPALGEAGHNPRGNLDGVNVSSDNTQISLSGWSFDPDAVNGVVAIRVSDTAPSGITRTVDGLANLRRDDVASAFDLVGQYGFAATLPAAGLGTNRVCVAAINIGRGTGDPTLRCVDVEVLGPEGCRSGDNDPTPSGVSAARTDTGTAVFVRGADDGVWYLPTDSRPNYASLSGQIKYGPSAVSWGGDRLDLFVVGLGGQLFHRAGSTDGPWSWWESLGGTLTASPTVVSFAPNTLQVFGRGADGQLWTIAWTGTAWTSWSSAGGQLASAPGAVVDRDSGRATVGVRGGNGRLFELRFGVGGLGSYAFVGSALCSAPAYAARVGDGDLRLLAVREGDSSLSVGGISVGGQITSAPAVVMDPTGSGISAFARGLDNALWVYRGPRAAGAWSSLGGVLH
jgi:hypothetical protein